MSDFGHLFSPLPQFPNAIVERSVSAAYEAMTSGTLQALAPLLAADVEFWFRGEPENVPFGGTWSGPKAVAKFVETRSANVREPVFRARYTMLQEDADGTAFMLFLSEEGVAAPTGKIFASESVHEWRIDKAGRIMRFAGWNNSFDFFQAFSEDAEVASLVFRHPLDEAIVTPTRPCAIDAGAAVERFYHRLVADDWAGLAELMAPEVVSTLEGVEGIVPFAGTFRKREEFNRQALTFARLAQAVVDNVIPRYVVDGNRVCTRFDEAGTYLFGTGCALYFTNLHCFTVNDAGFIETFRSYNDTWQVWLNSLPEKARPAGVGADVWKRHRRKPDPPPTAGKTDNSTKRTRT